MIQVLQRLGRRGGDGTTSGVVLTIAAGRGDIRLKVGGLSPAVIVGLTGHDTAPAALVSDGAQGGPGMVTMGGASR